MPCGVTPKINKIKQKKQPKFLSKADQAPPSLAQPPRSSPLLVPGWTLPCTLALPSPLARPWTWHDVHAATPLPRLFSLLGTSFTPCKFLCNHFPISSSLFLQKMESLSTVPSTGYISPSRVPTILCCNYSAL